MPSYADFAGWIGTRRLVTLMNLYPPYVGAGIRVKAESDRVIVSEMSLRGWNKNFIGAHFGGSLYAMCDPFYVLLIAGELGSSYLVLDKAANVRFLKLGRGKVSARFEITDAELEGIRSAADERGRVEPTFTARVIDEEGQLVAEVDKLLYVRKKRGKPWEKAFG